MTLFGTAAENALHCMLLLSSKSVRSARDLAEFQGVSPSYTAKLFTKLQKAGLVEAGEGIRGGFKLAKPAIDISVLEVVDAVEDGKRLFRCRNIRADCVLFDGDTPSWARSGTCSIHAVMLEAEKAMRDVLASHSLEELSKRVGTKAPSSFLASADDWFAHRRLNRIQPSGRSGAPTTHKGKKP